MNTAVILAVAFVICLTVFILMVRKSTQGTDWSKKKKLKDPVERMKAEMMK